MCRSYVESVTTCGLQRNSTGSKRCYILTIVTLAKVLLKYFWKMCKEIFIYVYYK